MKNRRKCGPVEGCLALLGLFLDFVKKHTAECEAVLAGVLTLVLIGLVGAAESRPAREAAPAVSSDPVIVEVVTPAPVAPVPEVQPVETAPVGPVVPDYIRPELPLDEAEQTLLYEAAVEFGVPYELAVAVVWRESRFTNVYGDSGASVGYMQIQPRWWSWLMDEIGAVDLGVPRDNFRTGCAILAYFLERYPDWHSALMAYNCGESRAAELWAAGRYSTEYSSAVVGYAEEFVKGGF